MDINSEKNESNLLINKDEKSINNEGDIKDESENTKYFAWFHLPKAVYFIIITELCERFTYYGMRSILILYLTQHLLLKEWNAVPIFHFFACLCYLTTIFGCIVSDNFLGKYKTMIILGTVYTIGSALMSLTAVPERNLSGPLISLILIGFGTGGVKSCVAPFGGDQIESAQKDVLSSYFSMFYFAINLGALLSTIISPILRANVACNGSTDCYPLAFGVPAILMGAAMIIFLIGRRHYIEVPISSKIYMRAISCIADSIKRWIRERRSTPGKRLLDYAHDRYDDKLKNDIRTLGKIAIMFLPLPIYWALFEQMGSRWTLQATQMDGEITEHLTILPDQMFIFNVLLVVILVLVFDHCIYPLFPKKSLTSSSLVKMTIGFTFTFLAFIATFLLQKYIEDHQPPAINVTNSRLVLVNCQPCITLLLLADGRSLDANSYQTSAFYLDTVGGTQQIQLVVSKCYANAAVTSMNRTVMLSSGRINFIIVETSSTNNIIVRVISDYHIPNIKGHPLIRLTVSSNLFDRYIFQLKHSSNGKLEKQIYVVSNESVYTSDWITLSTPGRYIWYAIGPQPFSTNSLANWTGVIVSNNGRPQINPFKIVSSEVSIFYMTFSSPMSTVVVIPLSLNKGSRISVMWQLPQYVLISIGEVLVNVPGLTFSYDQAPIGMKSLVNSLWYLCDAFGNIIVIIVTKIRFFEKQSFEYLTYAIVCAMFNVIFAGLAYWYTGTAIDNNYIQVT